MQAIVMTVRLIYVEPNGSTEEGLIVIILVTHAQVFVIHLVVILRQQD
jgi:hypothetical protein